MIPNPTPKPTPDARPELEPAGWFRKDQIREAREITIPPAFSLAGQILQKFLDDET